MQLSLQTFQQLIQRMSAALQNSAGGLIDLSVGSVARAILEANASVGLWLQWLIVQTLAVTRAATSSGDDLDTWMADFSLSRLQAIPARGTARFSRLSANTQANIPAGTKIKTSTGSQVFEIISDQSRADWLPQINSYLLPMGVLSIDLPVVATVAGSHGNVTSGAITLISSALAGVDTVMNTLALSGGMDAEQDEAFRRRFRDYINSRSQATMAAVSYAIESIQQSTRYAIYENTDSSGASRPGQFLVVIDDGSGQVQPSLIATAYAAVDAVRPLATSFSITPATTLPVAVTLIFKAGSKAVTDPVASAIRLAVSQYINQLPVGGTLFLSRVIETAYEGGPLPQNISSVLINGVTADLQCPPRNVLIAGSVMVLQNG